MTGVVRAKPPAPPLTRVVQVIGLAAVVGGIWILVEAIGCSELDCLASILGGMVLGWGVLALLAGMRNLFGFFCLIGAIILGLLASFVTPWFSLPFLLVVFLLLRVSKDKLKPFYRNQPEVPA